MKRTYEKKSAQPVASVKPTTLNLQTRGFAPTQPELDEGVLNQPRTTSSENLLEKLISTSRPESAAPIQRKTQNLLKAARVTIQAKLNIGEPNDKYEKEADDTASKVVQQINSPTQDRSVQKQESMEVENEELQMKPISSIQRDESMEEEEELQMKSLVQRRENLAGGEASTDLESSIQSARGGGRSLDPSLQTKMGQAMGADFSGVKVHNDSRSDKLNKSIQAKAFTTGQDIFFRKGEYNPSSLNGQELIAHELTHTIQQNSSVIGTKRDFLSTDRSAFNSGEQTKISHSLQRSSSNHTDGCQCSACSGKKVQMKQDNLSRHSGACGCSTCSGNLGNIIQSKNEVDIYPSTKNKITSSERPTLQRALTADMTKEDFLQELSNDDNLSKRLNHKPSTGLGKFDAEYEPNSGNLIITVKTFFQFGDKGNSGDFEEGIGGWTKNEKTGFITSFKNQAESAWSGKFNLNCIKAGFEGLTVKPVIRFEAVDSYDQAHFNHKISKDNPVMGTGIGREQDDDPNQLNVGNFKLADSVPGAQPTGMCQNIAGHDKARLMNLMEGYKVNDKKPLEFKRNGSSELDSPSKSRLTAFANRLVETSRMGSVPVPIIATGVANKSERNKTGTDKSQNRADTIANFLRPLIQNVPNARPNPVNTEVFDETSVTAAKQEYESKTSKRSREYAKEKYTPLKKVSYRRIGFLKFDAAYQWAGDPYSVLAHEFGHMLGNSDEYFEYGDVSIKDQYAQSLLKTKKPDNVARAKFLAKKGGISTNDKLKTQQATFDLAEKAGTDLPEFDSKSSSIMSAGADVLPLHYLPIWEVLGKITAPTIKPEEWKIG